jgi:hypothetical protein
MHSALFLAIMPKRPDDWDNFTSRVNNKVKETEAFSRLAENVWLVDVTKSPGVLAYLISFAQECRLRYGILPFERAPQWLPADFDSKPT